MVWGILKLLLAEAELNKLFLIIYHKDGEHGVRQVVALCCWGVGGIG